MNRSGLSLGGAVATSLALLAVTACGAAPDATAPPAGTSLAAGIAQQNAETDRALHLLVRLELSADELFEIYEPAPGQVVISGAGAPSNPVLLPQDVDSLTIEQIWLRVAGDQPMPESLVAALPRTAVGITPPRELTPSHPGPKPPPVAALPRTAVGITPPRELTPSHPGPKPPPVAPEAGWCNVDYYELGYAANAESSSSNVCAVEGNVTLEVKSSGRYAGIWNVPENTVRWYRNLQR